MLPKSREEEARAIYIGSVYVFHKMYHYQQEGLNSFCFVLLTATVFSWSAMILALRTCLSHERVKG